MSDTKYLVVSYTDEHGPPLFESSEIFSDLDSAVARFQETAAAQYGFPYADMLEEVNSGNMSGANLCDADAFMSWDSGQKGCGIVRVTV